MSCFMLSNYALSVLGVQFVEHVLTGKSQKDKKTPAQVGKLLWEANLAAMKERYAHNGDVMEELPKVFRFDSRATQAFPSPVEVIKQIHCLDYQACDWRGWLESAACNWMQELREEMIRQLPGYEQAPWGMQAPKGERKKRTG